MSDVHGSVTQFFEDLKSGQKAAAGPLWDRYFPRLLGLARKTLSSRSQRVHDAEDAVLSAFASFWKQAEQGGIEGELNRNNLWNLLGTMTVRKAMRHARHESARKRGGGQVVGESRLMGNDGDSAGGLDAQFSKVAAVDVDLVCEEFMMLLDEDLRPFAVLRLMSYRNKEIADLMQCSEHKVERKLALIRKRWRLEVDRNE